MSTDKLQIQMPDLGDVAKAMIVQWLKPLDSAVCEGDDLLEVETEKATFVIPAPASGRLVAIHLPEASVVETGISLGEIEPD